MDNNEIQQNGSQATAQQINTARDGVTLARLVLADEIDAAAAMVQSLLNDPTSIPGVLYGLCGLIADALPPEVAPETFFQGAYTRLDGLSQG